MIGKRHHPKSKPCRRFAAVLMADSVPDGESWAEATIRACAQEVFRLSGSNLIATFASAEAALSCALRVQGSAIGRLRLAVASGHVTIGRDSAGGRAVESAASLVRQSPRGGIALSSSALVELNSAMPMPIITVGPKGAAMIGPEACMDWQQDSQRRADDSAGESRITLAVVPIDCEEPDRPLANRVVTDVARGMVGLSTWFAVSRTPGERAAGQGESAQVTGARYVLRGWLRREGDTVCLDVEAYETATNLIIFMDQFRATPEDPGGIRNVAGPRIAATVAMALTKHEMERIERADPATLTAQDLALRAWDAVMRPEPRRFAEAYVWLRAALKKPQPHSAVHLVRVAWHLLRLTQGWADDPRAELALAVAATDDLDREDPTSMALLGYFYSVVQRDHAQAITMIEQVLDEAPACATAWTLKAHVLCQLGMGEEAVEAAERAEALPVLGSARAWRAQATAMAYYVSGRTRDAVQRARISNTFFGGLAITARVLAASLVAEGCLAEAQQAGKAVMRITPAFRVGAMRQRGYFSADIRDEFASRLRLAGLEE
jgi:tetratricopeptide (TPR) repeat protein